MVASRSVRGVRMGKLFSLMLFIMSAVFLTLALIMASTKGTLDVFILDCYFVVLPCYLSLIAAILFSAGWIVRRLLLAHP